MIYSKYTRNKLVDAALRGGTITFPATLYVALLTSKPTPEDVYNEIGNVTANGYTRVSYASSTTNWSAADTTTSTASTSSGSVTGASNNLNVISFPNPTGNWFNGSGTEASEITYIGLFDSATIGAGNLWFIIPLVGSKKIYSGEFNITVPAKSLVLTFDS